MDSLQHESEAGNSQRTASRNVFESLKSFSVAVSMLLNFLSMSSCSTKESHQWSTGQPDTLQLARPGTARRDGDRVTDEFEV